MIKEKLKTTGDELTYAKNNCISPKETAFELHNRVNLLLEKSINQILSKIPIDIVSSGVKIGENVVEWYNPIKKVRLDVSIKLKNLLNEIFNDPKMGKCFKILYDSFPVISNQLDNAKLDLLVNHLSFKLFRGVRKKDCKGILKDRENLNLLDTSDAFCIYNSENKEYIVIEAASDIPLIKIQLAGAEVMFDGYLPNTWIPVETKECECEDLTTGKMIKYPCDGPLPPQCKEDITPIELKLDLVDAFDFDKVEKGDGTSFWYKDGGEQFQKFIKTYNQTKDRYSMVWDQYLEFLKDKGVIIYGYASRDDDPDEDMRGEYADCNVDKIVGGTKQARHLYNKCLSEKRAAQVIKDIVAEIPELDGILKPIGKGESCKSGNCWKSGAAVNTDNTKEDRRVTGTFPKFKTKIKN